MTLITLHAFTMYVLIHFIHFFIKEVIAWLNFEISSIAILSINS